MTTNEIEKQLIKKSKEEIQVQARDIVNKLEEFAEENAGLSCDGMRWYYRRIKPNPKYEGQNVDDPWNHYDWSELCGLIMRNMEENLLEDMVKIKSKELLKKLDLFE
tara:strand:+ start:692 stop:1012 length:321 start_codon:yes stop_codon:yes gene_type:complete